MKKVQKIMFQMEKRDGTVYNMMVNNKTELVLKVAEMVKMYGKSNIRVVKRSIRLSTVIQLVNSYNTITVNKAV